MPDIQTDPTSNIDPFDVMDRAKFRRFAKHHLGKKYDPRLRRDDIQLGDGTVERGLKSMLKQKGLTGREPLPDGIREAGPKTEEDVRRMYAQAEIQEIKNLSWKDIRSLAAKRGVPGDLRKMKRPELEAILIGAVDGADTSDSGQ